MTRSLKINSQHIKQAKLAVKRQGYLSQKALAEELGYARATVSNFLNGKPVDYTTFLELSQALSLDWQVIADLDNVLDTVLPRSSTSPRTDWSDAVDVSIFYGRTLELTTLEQWICQDHCRLVTLLGMGGIGKTALAIKLAQQISHSEQQTGNELSGSANPDSNSFDYIIWRSLGNAPFPSDLLAALIEFLSGQQETVQNIPKDFRGRLSRFLHYLRTHRCLVILDNVETILQSQGRAGHYCTGYEDYGELFQQVGNILHQSCLLLTSREKPNDVAILEGDMLPVRSLQIAGLSAPEVQVILADKGLLSTEAEVEQLTTCYNGNPLALKIVATTVRDLFAGNITAFLSENTPVFNGIRLLLDQQFQRLSQLEQQTMYWLTINREPVTIADLQTDLVPSVSSSALLEALESLNRRCLIETVPSLNNAAPAKFTQQSVVIEYVSNRLIEQVCAELQETAQWQNKNSTSDQPNGGLTSLVTQPNGSPIEPHAFSLSLHTLFHTHALIKATAKDYIRTSQIRVILAAIATRLLATWGSQQSIKCHLHQILLSLRQYNATLPGYGAGNLINLCNYLQISLESFDFSHLTIWQADLRQSQLHSTNFAYADLSKSMFAEVFSNTLSVTLSPDNCDLASGDADGSIRIWNVVQEIQGNINILKSIGQLRLTLQGHIGWVHSVCFSPHLNGNINGLLIASGGSDCTVRIWDVTSGQSLRVLNGHTSSVWCVRFSPNGQWLASSGDDNTIRLWDPISGECLDVLQGHTDQVYDFSFSPDSRMLASGSVDQTIRLWEIPDYGTTSQTLTATELKSATSKANNNCCNPLSVRCLRVLRAKIPVTSVRFSIDSTLIAAGGLDHIVQLWCTKSGNYLATLDGHTDQIWCLEFSPDGKILASGSHDQTVRLWSVETGHCLKVLHGHTDRVWSVYFSVNGHRLITGSMDQTIRLWDTSIGQCLQCLQGYTNPVYVVRPSSDGILASGSKDGMVRLWDYQRGQCYQTLAGHTAGIWALHSSTDGQTLVSGSNDHTARLWNLRDGHCLHLFEGHTGWVLAVRLSPDGQLLATGSADHTARVWTIATQRYQTLSGHTSWVFAVDISPDGRLIATGSADHTIRLWDIQTGVCLAILEGHSGWVRTVCFSPDGQFLVSGGTDHTLRVWQVDMGNCARVIEGHTNWIWSVSVCPPSCQPKQEISQVPLLLASSSDDGTVRLWDGETGNCLRIFQGHTNRVWSVAFTTDGQFLVSGSGDETILLWDIDTGNLLQTLKAKRLYEGMNITAIKGLTDTQIVTLKSLGAIE